MAVFKFLKLDDSKENVKQSIESHIFIINKFRKVFNQLENVIDKKRPEEELDNIITNYDNEIYTNYISIKIHCSLDNGIRGVVILMNDCGNLETPTFPKAI